MSLIPSKRQHHFRPLCHLYLFILVFIYPSHPACWAAREMPPALCVAGSDPPGSSPHPRVLAWPRDVAAAPWPRIALCWLVRWDRPGKPGRTPPAHGFRHHQSLKFPNPKDGRSLVKILWCLLGAFTLGDLGDLSERSVPRTRPRSFHQDLWRKPHAHGMPASHQLIIRISGQDLCLGLPVQAGLPWGRRPAAQLAMKCVGCSAVTL